MANSENGGGGNGWLAFLVGGLLVAVMAIGAWVYSGWPPERETAQIELNVPDVNINPPDINPPDIDLPDARLPEPTPTPAPEPAPAQ